MLPGWMSNVNWISSSSVSPLGHALHGSFIDLPRAIHDASCT